MIGSMRSSLPHLAAQLASAERLRVVSLAVLDQGLVSITSFLTGLLLARYAAKEEYGAYAVVFSFILILNLFQSGLIWRPMAVIGSTKPLPAFRSYALSLLGGQVMVSLAAAALVVLVVWGVRGYAGGTRLGSAMLMMAAALVFMQGNEFIRRVLLTRTVLSRVVLLDILVCGTQLVLVTYGARAGWLTATKVVAAMGVSTGVGLIGGVAMGRPFLWPAVMDVRAAIVESWRFGRWMLATSLVSHGLGLLNVSLAAAFLGLRGSAAMEAARNIVAPTQILLFATGNVLPAFGSRRLSERGPRPVRRAVLGIATAIAAVATLLGVFASWHAETLLKLLYGAQYQGYGPVVYVYAANALLWNVSGVFVIGLETLTRPNWGFALMAVTGVTGLILAVFAVQRWGLYGLLLSGVLIETVRLAGSCILFEAAIRRAAHRQECLSC
jgi:O-antigen/teichoic acid export membrane protein